MTAAAPRLPHEAYLASLASLDEVGPARLRWLLSLDAPAEVWHRLSSGTLDAPATGRIADSARLAAWRRQTSEIEPGRLWQRCQALGVGVTSLGSVGYPTALLDDPEPPVVLFHLGDPDVLAARRVAIVGTRRCTGYGRRVAADLGRQLAAVGICVVSGLALGIDVAAHTGALGLADRLQPPPWSSEGNQGNLTTPPLAPAAAVVGAGLDAPCPTRNLGVARRLMERGVVLSEVPPGVSGAPWRFPVRNRILAGLAEAVVVVESAGSGGSMHTVREAMDRDRPVLAVPGPIDSRASEGTNQLIGDGALVCGAVDDVLRAIGASPPTMPAAGASPADDPRPPPDATGEIILSELGWRPATIDDLIDATSLDVTGVAVAIGALEATGWVRRSGPWVERVALGHTRTEARHPPTGAK